MNIWVNSMTINVISCNIMRYTTDNNYIWLGKRVSIVFPKAGVLSHSNSITKAVLSHWIVVNCSSIANKQHAYIVGMQWDNDIAKDVIICLFSNMVIPPPQIYRISDWGHKHDVWTIGSGGNWVNAFLVWGTNGELPPGVIKHGLLENKWAMLNQQIVYIVDISWYVYISHDIPTISHYFLLYLLITKRLTMIVGYYLGICIYILYIYIYM